MQRGLSVLFSAAVSGIVASSCYAEPDCSSGVQTPVVLSGMIQADAQFGWAVGNVGDFDNDGLGDVGVGARFCNVGAIPAAGAVFVYRSDGTSFGACVGQQADEHFGESLKGGFDVNGDLIDDLVVGAPLRNGGAGAVEVILGGDPVGLPRWGTLHAEAADDWFGQSVAIGDLTGDGLAEVIVGAPYNDRGGSAAGAVFIYRGGAAPSAAPMVVLVGEGTNNHFGWSVAYLGDFDGDGFGDVAAGARLYGLGPTRARGKVYLFRGGAAMDNLVDGSWVGQNSDDWFGQSVAGVGDVDGGGRPDLLVGAPYNDAAASNAGAAYLFRGENPLGSAAVRIMTGESADAQFGWSVGGGSDVNADGRPDMLVGARLEDPNGQSAAGRAYIFTGTAPGPAWSYFNGRAAGDWLGNSVDGVAAHLALNHDASAAGAPYADQSGASAAGEALRVACPVAGEPTCAADVDGNGVVDVFDLLEYLSLWFVGAADAELTGDVPAAIDVFDLLAYLSLWFPASANSGMCG